MLSTRCSVHVVTKSLTYYNNNKCPAKVNLKVNKFSTFGGYSGVESFLKCKIGHNIATKIVLIENVFGDQIKGEVFNSFAAVVIHYGLVMMYKIVHGLVVIPTSFSMLHKILVANGHSSKFLVQSTRVSAFRYSYFPATIMSWNGLPAHLIQSPSVECFKSQLAKFRPPAGGKRGK